MEGLHGDWCRAGKKILLLLLLTCCLLSLMANALLLALAAGCSEWSAAVLSSVLSSAGSSGHDTAQEDS